jgi:hypothetical protein
MLDIHTFAQLNKNPSITDISLKLLQEYYEYYLLNNTYQYHLEDGQVISLPFKEKDFCHLLGIKKIIERAIHPSKHYKYYGEAGYENVKNRTIDFNHLKTTGGKTRFNDSKDKMVFFFLIHRMAEAPHEDIFVEYSGKSGTKVQVKFLVYDICEKGIGHLGLSFNEEKGFWFPKSYMTERISESNDGTSLISGRDTISVIKTVKK